MFENLVDDRFVLKDDRIAVGVSGGADSMLLLWALLDKQKQIGFDLHVIHVNHHLRGAESDRDSKFVADFCKKKKIKCSICDVDVKKMKTEEKKTIEETARVARYDEFKKVMKKENLNKLFLAHHKNDQAETILMHIFRGSGIDGACGIKENDKIFRPLLNLTKAQILEIAKDYGIRFVEDSTNFETDCARNYLRNKIIPEIEKVYPSAVDALYQFGKICSQAQKMIEMKVNQNLIFVSKEGVTIKASAFDAEPLVVREYIKQAFNHLQVFSDIEQKHYELICDLNKKDVNKEISLPHNVVARKTYEGIKLEKAKKRTIQNAEFEFALGELDFFGEGTIFAKIVSSDEVVYEQGVIYADYNKISSGAVWRTRRSNDKFAKLGTGTKKLNDYFTDKKIDISKRDQIPVLAKGNTIYVVAGYDVGENVKIDGTTDQIVKIEFSQTI